MFIQPKKFWLAGSASLYAVSGSTPFSITYVSNASNAVAGASFSFSAQNIGTADPTRLVVVALTYLTTGVAPTAVTIGGVSAIHVSGALSDTNASGSSSDIWVLAVSSGTSATIAITFASSVTRCAIQVFNVLGTGASVSTGAANQNASTVTSLAQTATVPAGGGAIAVVAVHSSTASSFAGTNLTLDNGFVTGGSTAEAGHTTTASGATSMGFTWVTGADCALSIVTFNS